MSEGSVTRAGAADDREMEPAVAAELLRLRGSIDNMDAALIHLLAERFKITQQVGHLKAEYGLPPADPAREAQQIARLRSLAIEAKLDPEFAEKFLTFVVAEVVRHHETLQASRGRIAVERPGQSASAAARARPAVRPLNTQPPRKVPSSAR